MRPALLMLIACFATPTFAAPEDEAPGLGAELAGHRVPLPTLSTDVDVHLAGDLATVHVRQTYGNPYVEPVHARYVFPLPPDAAVFGMRMQIGERVIEGMIAPIEQAQAAFAQAQQQGKSAALLEERRPDVFQQRVANLLPGRPITVELQYVHPVPRRDGRYEFHFPMVVGPRFTPRGTADPVPAPPVADKPDPARVGLAVQLDAGLPIQWLDSPSHAIDIVGDAPTKRFVRLAEGRVPDDQDFVLRYRLAADQADVAVTTWRPAPDEAGVVSLLIEPPRLVQDAEATPREVVFVLDTSGSMEGEPLAASVRFVRQMLDSLRPDDTFRLVRFGSDAEEWGPPAAPTRRDLKRANAWLNALRGEGGTDMAAGVTAALSPPIKAERLRLVVFLTDGYIGNDIEVIALVRAWLGDARLFSLGVGNGVNHFLLEDLARVGRGVARFVRPDEDVEHAADTLAERLATPYLTDVQIDWGEAPVFEATPDRLPDLFAGEPLRVLARFDGEGTFPITVRGQLAGVPVHLPAELTLPRVEPAARALPIIWARRQVADRMHLYEAPLNNDVGRDALREEVLALGMAYGILTRWTAFVAIDHEVVKSGPAHEADVAVPPVAGVSPAAYGEAFAGHAAPEPAQWAALLLLLALAAVFARRARLSGGRPAR